MDIFFNFFKSEFFFFILFILVDILCVLYIVNVINLKKLRTSYSKFMNKLGNGNNIEEIMRDYILKVEKLEKKNEEIISYCKVIDDNIKKCTQKVGIVRYNAFKDVGSDLSFSIALLDDYNNGVVLSGIYARDSSNIYAKPIEKGSSKHILSEEEKEAINRAINNIK